MFQLYANKTTKNRPTGQRKRIYASPFFVIIEMFKVIFNTFHGTALFCVPIKHCPTVKK